MKAADTEGAHTAVNGEEHSHMTGFENLVKYNTLHVNKASKTRYLKKKKKKT